MGPKQINSCMPEPMGIQRCGKVTKRIQFLEEGRVSGKEAKSWRIEGEKNHEKGISEAVKKIEMEGSTAQKGMWKLAKEKK